MWGATGYIPENDEFENTSPDTFTLFEPYALFFSTPRQSLILITVIDTRDTRTSPFHFTMPAVGS
jgi:hypothetical protein